jgi:magnesium transporter
MRLLKRVHPPGTAPGTLPVSVAPTQEVSMRTLCYSDEELTESDSVDVSSIREIPAGQVSWLDLVGHDIGLIAQIGQRLGLHPLAVEDVVNVGQRPKTEDFGDALFIVVDLPRRGEGAGTVAKEQISLILQDSRVVTFREAPGPVFDPVVKRLRGASGRIRRAGPDYLVYALIDTVVDHYFPVLDGIGQDIEDLEEAILERAAHAHLAALHRIKSELVVLRKSAWPMRDAVGRLYRLEHAQITQETQVFLRDVADHLAVIVDMIETYREMVISLTDLYLSSMSNRMNEVMKVLTIIATIFIPLSFIAGLYGMNFDRSASPLNMPELGWYWGYPMALGVMAAVALGLLLFFRRRRWI